MNPVDDLTPLRRALEADDVPAAIGECARLKAILQARLAHTVAPTAVVDSGDDDDLLDDPTVARLLSVPASYVADLRKRGVVPSVQLGKYVRVRRGDIRAFVRAERTLPA